MTKKQLSSDPKDWGKTDDPLESFIQRKVVEYADSLGVHARKWSSPSQRSVPDYLFFFDYENLLVIEFKRKDKTASHNQSVEMQHLADRGFSVVVIDNIADGKEVILEYYKKAADMSSSYG